MIHSGSKPGKGRVECAVVGYGRCIASVRRTVEEVGVRSGWFPELRELLEKPHPRLRLVVFAPHCSVHAIDSDLMRLAAGLDSSALDMLAVVSDSGLHSPRPEFPSTLDVLRLPHQRARLREVAAATFT